MSRAQSRLNSRAEEVGPIDHGRAGIEKQAPAGTKPIERLLHNTHGEIQSELAAAVTINPARAVDQVWRVGNNEIADFVDFLEQVAAHRLCSRNAVERGIDCAVAQRLAIDIGQNDVGGCAAIEEKGSTNSS